ncbi:MAG: ribbon-helix-helix protein, CopG family [Planctomycetes bacterium]|nr:ribbon-helix-helix protein, CopG family [Planctomycetota bacterium]
MSVSCKLQILEDLAKRYDALAKQTGRTKTVYLRQAIKSYIEDLEDASAGKAILERVRRGQEEVLSLADGEQGLVDTS